MAFIDMTQIIMKMFKNPLKYQSGGSTPTQQQQDQLVQLFQAAAQNAQVDPEALVKKAQELGQDENAAAQFMEGLQRCAQGDPAGIQFIKSLFTPSHKHGGKIQDFICKHGKGGAIAGCGCEKPVLKGQEAIPGGMPRFQVVRDTTYTNPANRRIMEQVIVGPNGQAYRRTTENGINPIVIGGYWDGQFTPEGDDAIPVQRFDSLFRRAIPRVKNNQNVIKEQNAARPIPKWSVNRQSEYVPDVYTTGGYINMGNGMYGRFFKQDTTTSQPLINGKRMNIVRTTPEQRKEILSKWGIPIMPIIPQYDIDSINPNHRPGRVVIKQKPIKWNRDNFIFGQQPEYEPTFVEAPTEFGLNSWSPSENRVVEYLDSLSSKTGIPVEILKDFGKTRRYLEVYRKPITK